MKLQLKRWNKLNKISLINGKSDILDFPFFFFEYTKIYYQHLAFSEIFTLENVASYLYITETSPRMNNQFLKHQKSISLFTDAFKLIIVIQIFRCFFSASFCKWYWTLPHLFHKVEPVEVPLPSYSKHQQV